MNIPIIERESLIMYLRQVADWIELEGLDIPELTVKVWPNIGTVHINFVVKERS